ncbi:MAG: hypothetical protein HY923_03500 [Elusimicrobia bacterium]|nr:hypothetical protein [Elusimicrobiota bacterium]
MQAEHGPVGESILETGQEREQKHKFQRVDEPERARSPTGQQVEIGKHLGGVVRPDELVQRPALKRNFSPKEIAELAFVVAAGNFIQRIGKNLGAELEMAPAR